VCRLAVVSRALWAGNALYLCDWNSSCHLGISNTEWASSTNASAGVLCMFLFNGGCGGRRMTEKNKCSHVENLRERVKHRETMSLQGLCYS